MSYLYPGILAKGLLISDCLWLLDLIQHDSVFKGLDVWNEKSQIWNDFPSVSLVCFALGQVCWKYCEERSEWCVWCSVSPDKVVSFSHPPFFNGNAPTRGSQYWVFTQHRLHFKTKTRRAIQHTLTPEPLSPTVWLSHQRIQLGSLLLNIITLNKVAFLIFVSFFSRDLTKRKMSVSIFSPLDGMGGEMFWSRKVYLFVKLCGLCLVLKLHLICRRYKDD